MALVDNIVSYWKLDETSGTRVDSNAATNDLTDNNTVGYGTGKISNGADFIAANSESLSHTEVTAFKYDGTNNLSVSFWFKADAVTGVRGLIGQYNGGSEWLVYLNGTSLVLLVRNAGAAITYGSAISTGTWYHVVVTLSSSNTYAMIVNDGTPGTSSGATGTPGTGVTFRIGAYSNTATGFFDGIIDEAGIWSKVLSAAEITSLYNGGSGFTYPFSAGGSGPANLKSYNTNLTANIKSINTNLIANVKSLDTNA